jgi:hypothetical protein
MLNGTSGLHYRRKIQNQKIVFCAIHDSAEKLFVALEYARRFLADDGTDFSVKIHCDRSLGGRQRQPPAVRR